MIIYLIAVLIVAVTGFSYKNRSKSNRAKIENKKKVEKKLLKTLDVKKRLESQLQINGELISKRRQMILDLPVMNLIEQLQRGKLKCLEVLQAYQAKALGVTKELNCVTEFVKEAEEWAMELDRADIKGPLHGVPFCVKDNIDLAGYDSTFGLAQNLDKPRTRDAVLVAVLKDFGAVPFCKTNAPQAVMTLGCSNTVWGTTLNPWCKERTSGGSSGGDACLVAAGGTAFSLGSDAGGSIRVPPAFCGIPSIKASQGRFSSRGFGKPTKDAIGVTGVPGIMARDVETIAYVAQLLTKDCRQRNYDANVVPIPWQENVFKGQRTLRIGVYDFSQDCIPPTPGVLRAMSICRQVLEQEGHVIVPLDEMRAVEAHNSQFSMIFADNTEHLCRIMEHEEVDGLIKDTIRTVRWIPYVRPLLRFAVRKNNPRTAELFAPLLNRVMSRTEELREEINFQTKYKVEFFQKWKHLNLDLCLTPVFPAPAPKNSDIGKLGLCAAYCCPQNFANFPSGVVPVTKETEGDQKLLTGYPDDDALLKTIKETTIGAVGMPISVQLFAMPWEEEKVIQGMRILKNALSENKIDILT